MSSRWLVVGVLGMLGCDRVFGLKDREPEVPIDATMAEVVSIQVPASLEINQAATIMATVQGAPGTAVTCTFSATRGAVSGGDVLVSLDGTGAAIPSVEYTAPATRGEVSVRVAVGVSTKSATLTVIETVTAGHDSNLGGTVSAYAGGTLVGTQVVLPNPLLAREIGMWATVLAGTRARIGVYDVNLNLVVTTGVVGLASDRNAYPLATGQQLAAGTYWVVSVFDQLGTIFSEPTATNEAYIANAAIAFDQPMPLILPPGTFTGLRHSHFLTGNE